MKRDELGRRLALIEARGADDDLPTDLRIEVTDVYVTRAEALAMSQARAPRSRPPESLTDLRIEVVNIVDDEPAALTAWASRS